MKKILLTTLMACYVTSSLAEKIVAPELHIDPFINPLLTVQIEAENMVEKESTGFAATVEMVPRKSFLWQPELRGIIRSEDIAIANMAGEMIELGHEYEGFRLIKVKDQSVVFEKNGKQYPVSLDGTDEAESAL